jgi:lipoate-protein ligase A
MRMTSLKEELRRDISPGEVAEALRAAFERTLEINLQPDTLDDEESLAARRLAKEKYGAEEWTTRT